MMIYSRENNEERKFMAKLMVDFVAYKALFKEVDKLGDSFVGVSAIADDGFTAGNIGDFPTFTDAR